MSVLTHAGEKIIKHDSLFSPNTTNPSLGIVERALCEVVYDRIFMNGVDDASHDEALSSRVAAVNLVDLTLAHLDVDVGGAADDLNSVITACGQTLQQLDICFSPGDKSAVLVSAYKVLVDGLSKLPPIRLKPGDEEKDLSKLLMSLSFDSPTALVGGSASPLSIPIVMAPDLEPATPPIPESVTLVNLPLGGSTTTTSVNALSRRHAHHPLIITPPTNTPVSGDVLLPLLIFTLAKSNPPHLVSHLLFTHRFRATSVGGGEEAYCLINLLVAASFLENVDLEALHSPSAPLLGTPAIGMLRGRVEQQVDAIAGSANKVISGVVDSSFGVLRSFLPTSVPGAPGLEGSEKGVIQPNIIRRESGFSIASLAASVAQRRQQTQAGEDGEDGQQLVAVISRPGSVKSGYGDGDQEGTDEESEEPEEAVERASTHDARSVRSFESMMNASAKSNRSRRSKHKRDIGASGSGGGGSVGGISKSLTDRLASVAGGLGRLSQDKDRDKRTSLLSVGARADSPASVTLSLQRPASPTGSLRTKLAPPKRRLLEATEDDIRFESTFVSPGPQQIEELRAAFAKMTNIHEDAEVVLDLVVLCGVLHPQGTFCRDLRALRDEVAFKNLPFVPSILACIEAGVLPAMTELSRREWYGPSTPNAVYMAQFWALESLSSLMAMGDVSERRSLVQALLQEGALDVCVKETPKKVADFPPHFYTLNVENAMFAAHAVLCTFPPLSRQFYLVILKEKPHIIDLLFDCAIFDRPEHYPPSKALTLLTSRTDWLERLIEVWMHVEEEDSEQVAILAWIVWRLCVQLIDILTHNAESCGISNAQIESLLHIAYQGCVKCSKALNECKTADEAVWALELDKDIYETPHLMNPSGNVPTETPFFVPPRETIGPTAVIRLFVVLVQRKALDGIQTLLKPPNGLTSSTSLAHIQLITHPDMIRRIIKLSLTRILERTVFITSGLNAAVPIDVPAGINTVSAPMGLGQQVFALERKNALSVA
ncbi:hypothetical protein CONPUDRAFT_154356 [Coniophora puteana RWD-64-598 SS2]|uniref:VPS9 domain-containing protein n=1 Tax=Coniophora puteana (strain RWD-64-598) TaxID=741705 RepID=A0A5M3MMB5_CONPW|nr:uncharacterized protein CONPUDRAFT_154356 [Coniophora puteana RWD-64-598 SS2]EIW80318.1 hypothetical protein CONPUDRAFT_154356 [Coniophora puteana RWD-64-598 SS2]